VLEADEVGGRLTRQAARRFSLPDGMPMTVGMVDTSSAMLLAGTEPGQLLNVCGSTDVLALCTDRPRPHERLLTRALGVGRRWMSVSTIAAAASAIYWIKREFFPDWTVPRFQKEVRRIGLGPRDKRTGKSGPAVVPVAFEPYLAGDRASIEQRRAAFTGLTLATTRRQMLEAVIESLVRASAERLSLLRSNDVKIRRSVVVSGGSEDRLDEIFHRDWPGRWTFRAEDEATLRGLALLVPKG
jgi:xylulokinase